jgi:hypothetical protein
MVIIDYKIKYLSEIKYLYFTIQHTTCYKDQTLHLNRNFKIFKMNIC